MLRLKVEKFVKELRKEQLNQYFQNSRQTFIKHHKSQSESDQFYKFENLIEIIENKGNKLNQIQIISIYDHFYQNSSNFLNSGILAQFSKLNIQNQSFIFYVILNALCSNSNEQIVQLEQNKIFPFLFQIIEQQDLEIIDLAIDSLFQLTENDKANFYSIKLVEKLLDLINLQLIDIDIDQICFVISKSINKINFQWIVLENFSFERLADSIVFYISHNKKSIINLLLQLLDTKFDVYLLFNQRFFDGLWKLLTTKDGDFQINILYLMKQILQKCSKDYLLEIDFTYFKQQLQHLKQFNLSYQFIIKEIMQILDEQIVINNFDAKPFKRY